MLESLNKLTMIWWNWQCFCEIDHELEIWWNWQWFGRIDNDNELEKRCEEIKDNDFVELTVNLRFDGTSNDLVELTMTMN